MKLKVDRLSQNNWLWKWRRLGNSYLSIGGFGCYLTSLCMLMRYKGFVFSLPELNNALKKCNGFAGPEINSPGVIALLGGLWKYERKDWELVKANIDVIRELLDSGYPVIAKVDFNPNTKNIDGHFILITGYILEKDKIIDLWANDPWNGQEIQVCKKYPYLKLHTPETAILGLRVYRHK